jgi:cytidylate kinase
MEKMTNQRHSLRIAVDGPAASGKGTLAKKLAEALGLAYLDTGKLYRAVGYAMRVSGKDPANKDEAISCAENITLADTENEHLYDEGVGGAASIISAIPEVREALLSFQKEFLKRQEGAVLDGRDIGTVICPDADFKFFITADIEARAMRRFKQLQKEDKNVIYESVLQDLQRRDARDSQREIAPLKPAEDAICIDTTQMGAGEVLEKVLSYIRHEAVSS